MATLTVAASHDYTGNMLVDIDSIVFSASQFVGVIFDATQFGAGKISNSVSVNGDSHNIEIDIRVNGGTFSSANWTFNNWTSGNDVIAYLGNANADTITGSIQGDGFFARGGVDVIHGGAGADIFYFQAPSEIGAGSTYDGGADSDEIRLYDTAGSCDLSTTTISGVETLRLLNSNATAVLGGGQIGAGKITAVSGNTANNQSLVVDGSTVDLSGVTFANWGSASQTIKINGTAAADHLTGSSQNDILTGGGGDDTYTVANFNDKVIEAAGGGTDRVNAATTYALGAGRSVELLSTTNFAGTTAIALAGNGLAQQIGGNNGANIIHGKGGNDVMSGYGGHDYFVFETAPNTTTSDATITDFTVSGPSSDMIALSHAIYGALPTGALPASAFTVGSAATNASQHVIYNAGTGALLYDADGNGAGAAVQFAKLSTGLALTASQFQVIA